MEGSISMSAARERAERQRRVRQHLNGHMPPGRECDELHQQLDADVSALASSKLITG